MPVVITTRRAVDALPSYSVLVALDDDTDVRVKDGAGEWTVSSRFADQARADTTHWAARMGFRLIHEPGATR